MFKYPLTNNLLLIGFLTLSYSTLSDTVIHYTPLADPADTRLEYPLKVIDLAMHKTAEKYGAYQLKHIPQAISLARSIYELNRDTYPNYFFPGGDNIKELSKGNLIAADYPLDHGLLSYRICFVSPGAKAKVAAAKTIDDLRKFTIVQGPNWPDIGILKSNGFHVLTNPNHTGLFKMVISNRADLFCRGLSELPKEYRAYKSLGNLQYDESFVLAYRMPYAFYFNKNSKPAIERIEEGLQIAQKDGSLPKLFLQYHRDDILFAKLKQRKIFYLNSPYGKDLSPTYKSYIIEPLTIE